MILISFFQSKSCTKEINVDSTPGAAGITHQSEKFKLHFKAVRNGELQENYMDGLTVCFELDQKQKTVVSFCTKQIKGNHQ